MLIINDSFSCPGHFLMAACHSVMCSQSFQRIVCIQFVHLKKIMDKYMWRPFLICSWCRLQVKLVLILKISNFHRASEPLGFVFCAWMGIRLTLRYLTLHLLYISGLHLVDFGKCEVFERIRDSSRRGIQSMYWVREVDCGGKFWSLCFWTTPSQSSFECSGVHKLV